MSQDHRNLLKKIKPRDMIYPIAIGLGVVGYMIYTDFKPELFDYFAISPRAIFWLFMAVVFMFGRDIGYMIRIKVLSDGALSWKQAFRVIMLWEFTSAVTPSAVGGTSFAVIYVHKEGSSVGRSSSIVLLTSFFDELYFIVMFPLMVLLIGADTLFSAATQSTVTTGIMTIALTGYFLKLAYLLTVSYGLFVNPKGLKWLLLKIFRLKILRRWYAGAVRTGDDIITSSAELKRKGAGFWLKALASTFLSWSSRYMVVNAILLAFFTVGDHLLLFARQLVMWIMMLVMPTPGGSGFAEYFFKEYLADFIPVDDAIKIGVAAMIALIWRMATYYPYLAIGAVVFPRWLKAKFGK